MRNLGEGLFNRVKEETEHNINLLYDRLFSDNRSEDVRRAVKDKAYRDQLMKEYSLA